MFKIGDRVKIKDDEFFGWVGISGEIGTVIALGEDCDVPIGDPDGISVNLDNHDKNGNFRDDPKESFTWVYAEDLELLKEETNV